MLSFQELKRQVGKVSYAYEAEVSVWSRTEFNFTYSVRTLNHLFYLNKHFHSIHQTLNGVLIGFQLLLQVPSSDIFGGVLLQSPSLLDFDEREMFCLYMFPGNNKTRKVCCH